MRVRSQVCACGLIALSFGLLNGCANKSEHGIITSSPVAASRPIVTVTTKPAVAAAADPLAKKRFWFTYTFDKPGKRDWVRVADKKWEERWESGEVIAYVEGKRYEHDDIKGIIVTRDDGSLDVLIPDGGKGAMILFRDPDKNSPDAWSPLGAIEGFE